MEFSWSEEQRRFREAVIAFARRDLNDDLTTRDAQQTFSRAAWQRCADFGIQGLPIPEEYGGQGASLLSVVLGMEALGYACRDNGLIFSLNAHIWSAATPIVRFGSDAQKARWLPGLCDGSLIGVQGMTEPGSGSDAFSLTTTATRDGDRFILEGTKTFITNAPVADVFVVFASTDLSKKWAGLTAFLVARDTPGLTVGPAFSKMGLRTSPMSELVFSGCAVSEADVLGRPGIGMSVFNHSMDAERSCILAAAVGTMERQVEECVAYARERRQFGQAIGKFQAVSHRIAEMKLRLEAGRLLLYRMAWRKDAGEPAAMDASLVKLFLSESWVASSLDAIQIHGGYGYMTDSGIERDLRDAIAGRIYSGTSEMQRNLIARSLGL